MPKLATHWMTWFRRDRNPHAIHLFIPGHPLGGQGSFAATIVNHVNGVRMYPRTIEAIPCGYRFT